MLVAEAEDAGVVVVVAVGFVGSSETVVLVAEAVVVVVVVVSGIVAGEVCSSINSVGIVLALVDVAVAVVVVIVVVFAALLAGVEDNVVVVVVVVVVGSSLVGGTRRDWAVGLIVPIVVVVSDRDGASSSASIELTTGVIAGCGSFVVNKDSSVCRLGTVKVETAWVGLVLSLLFGVVAGTCFEVVGIGGVAVFSTVTYCGFTVVGDLFTLAGSVVVGLVAGCRFSGSGSSGTNLSSWGWVLKS